MAGRVVAIVGLAVALSALSCGMPPEREESRLSFEIPANWSTAPGTPAVVDGAWWREYGDEQLAALVLEALANNTDLPGTAARLSAAVAGAAIVGADRLPRVGAGLGAGREKVNFLGLDIPGSSDTITSRFDSYGLTLDTSWEVDLWGRLADAERAAWQDVASARIT